MITGAGSGIGSASAHLFASEGAAVAACDVQGAKTVAQEITKAGGTVIPVEMDVTSEKSVQSGVSYIVDTFGTLDIAFCCAGVWLLSIEGYREGQTDGPAELLTEAIWQKTIDTNLKGTYLVCRHTIPQMQRKKSGIIITVASVAALRVGSGASDAYTASKGGVLAMTRTLAVEHAGQGIRCNCLCPGPTLTAMASSIPDEHRAVFEQQIPLGRFGRPEELARAALFLASEDSSFMTGALLVVDGGYTAA